MRNRALTYAMAFVAIGILAACGGSAPAPPTMTSVFYDPPPPVISKMTVLSPSNGGTVPRGTSDAKLRLEFTFSGETFAVQIWVSPDESGDNWKKAGASLVDAARGVAEVPFGLEESNEAVTTRRVKVAHLVEEYEINWK
jgi:hypothetical protein